MTAFKKYRRNGALVLLLALYGFIATPVQVWHHHPETATSALEASTPDNCQQEAVSKSTAPTDAGNCSICSHHYSVFSNDVVIPFLEPINVTVPKNGFYGLPFIPSPSYTLANKGPPQFS